MLSKEEVQEDDGVNVVVNAPRDILKNPRRVDYNNSIRQKQWEIYSVLALRSKVGNESL
jgi:hypothetical protein